MDSATASMIRNLEEKTGRPFTEWVQIARGAGLAKHGEILALLKGTYGLGHGYANLIAHEARSSAISAPQEVDEADKTIFSGDRAQLAPLYSRIVEEIGRFGEDVEIAPKKAYVSFRRKKQFAIVQPSTRTRVDVGLNLRGLEASGRLETSGSFNSMCTHRVRIERFEDVDEELIGWLRDAYDRAV